MEDSKKKPIMIVVIVVCFILAGVIAYKHTTGGTTGLEVSGEMIWIKCTNPNCGAEYQISLEEYVEQKQQVDPMLASSMVFVCKDCEEETAFMAEKCKECETIFARDETSRYPDKCTKCGYSDLKERLKKVGAQ